MMLRCVPRRLLATKACSPGDVMKATRVFTREDLDAWARLTGDANAIHARPVPPFAAPIVPAPLRSRRCASSMTRRWNLTFCTIGSGILMCGVVMTTSKSRRCFTTFFFFCSVSA